MSMSYVPSPEQGSMPMAAAPDPVVGMIEAAGHRVGPGVLECATLAAAAHAQRRQAGRADGSAVNRSTFLWALGSLDEDVRAALAECSVRVEALQRLLGIRSEPASPVGHYELAEDLARALGTFVARPSKLQLTIVPSSLAVALMEDVVTHGGLLGERLRRLGTDGQAVLDALHRVRNEPVQGEGDAGDEPESASLPLVRELTPRQFGVHLPAGVDDLGPYVRRDIDDELDRRLREGQPVIAVVAPAVSGAIRTVYEALRRERPDDRVLLLHEWLEARTKDQEPQTAELVRLMSSGADVVWIHDFRALLLPRHPFIESLIRVRGTSSATVVLVVRPDDVKRADALGLLGEGVVELAPALSADEQARARVLYDGDVTQVASLAAATVANRGPRRANYATDSAAATMLDAATDDLGILADVDMLAKLIASKDVQPPLSIGLFGPWGSGKSYLMRQVQLRIADLAKKSRGLSETSGTSGTSDTSGTGYLSDVVPVEFNAWQYAHGTALWAALINRVFEEIRAQLAGDERYQKVLSVLADKDRAVAAARERVTTAQAEIERTRPAAGDRVIEKVAKHHDIGEKSTDQIKEGLDIDVATQQVSELKDEVERLKGNGAMLAKGWSTADRRRKAAVAGLVALGVVLVVVCLVVPAALGQLVALASAGLSLVGAVTKVLAPVNKGLAQARKVLRADDADKRRLKEAEEELARASAELEAARATGLAGLYGFVSERSSAAEYREQLGMAPVIRDDLERLAALSRQGKGIEGIDRIVIFIDDLDRCPPAEVVRVLEAVNLLFGFELFVVVVAVDSGWLMRSLKSNFSEAFDAEDGSAPTPYNYLEKIIQIPFWVQPMGATGFGKLVTSLAGEVDTRTAAEDPDLLREPPIAGVPGWMGHGPSAPSSIDVDVDDFGFTGTEDARELEGTPDVSDLAEVPTGTEEDSAVSTADDLNPAALRLTEDERDFMTKFLPLVETPRAVKRFLNTYQLLRVSVDDVETFLDEEEYKPLLILLAMMTGTTPLTPEMIAELRSMTEAHLEGLLAANEEGDEEAMAPWRPVAAACAGLPTETLTPEVIAKWLPRVARYSFHHVAA